MARTGMGQLRLPVWGGMVLLAVVLGGNAAPGAAPAKPAVKPSPTRSRPVLPAVAVVTPASLAAALKALGYAPKPHGPYQRLLIEEEKYGYAVDLGFSKSGEWVVALASLAPIPDLTRVRPASLLNLLSQNDSLLGMAFSYNRENAQLMLNATRPARDLTPKELQRTIEALKIQVRKTDGLWDFSQQ